MKANTPVVPVHVPITRRLAGRRGAFLVFDLETSDFYDAAHAIVRAAAAGHLARFAPGTAPEWVKMRLGPTEPDKGYPHPTGRVMQMAARRYEWDPVTRTGQMTAELNCLVNDPDILECCLSPGAQNTHHISLADLHGPGPNESLRNSLRLSPTEAWGRFLAMADGAILCGQNILGFDLPVTLSELTRNGITSTLDPDRSIDILLLAREVWSLRSNKLRELANFFGVYTDPSQDHDALADIATTWGVWEKMQDGLLDHDRRFGPGVIPDQYRGRLGGLGNAWPIIAPGTEHAGESY